ncbi:transmembrane protease serine 9-like [Toxorhynchites rutilus septentrionalis]|uniref:transmembrane protease serine 9-like n=1 Tax=Toxorhynchites rutilus septentrionalis TaxID=329112 RepID=UPI002478A72D|nr:transmembrane protease serine 9-like [Toxorhynchites rutilus septentrionalis]
MRTRLVRKYNWCGLVILVFGLAIDGTTGRLQPAENVFPTDVNNALLPNIRQSLNDCHLRYHKYGDYNLVYPIFGVPARIGEFAHMAAIGWTQKDGKIDFSCGGSLITTRHVLTTAHCGSREGIPPDVVLLGTIMVNASIDDPSNKFAQQHKIASFKRHPVHTFSSFYNDVALITLEGTVKINDVVTPACLWDQSEVEFPRLEAIGFGQTSFAGDKTPILLKVQLSPISNDECRKHHYSGTRRLRQGIADSQICAQDSKMDTCLGDSGGPLQIKLMSNHRSTPFVVGLTSFGAFCGTATPSVYTRVSSFISWIEQETNESFNAGTCASRYIQMREADESMVTTRSGSHIFIEPEKSYMDIEFLPKHQVYLGYMKEQNSRIMWNCGGVLINEDYVLTVAHCDKFVFNQTPTHVKIGDLDIHSNHPEAQIIKIEKFIKHPNYKEGFLANDIALVKLENDAIIRPNALPACLVDNDLTMPMYEMAGLGPFNLNNFLREEESVSKNNTLTLTRMRVDATPCQRTNSNQFLCAKNNKFLVPNTCRIEHGGALERETWHYDRYFQYVFGLTVAGKNCGFGSEAYFIRTTTHIEWIESIVLGKRNQNDHGKRLTRQIYFPGMDLNAFVPLIGKPCRISSNALGSCQYYRNCPNSPTSMVIAFCSRGSDPIVCCAKPPTTKRYSLQKCVAHWNEHKRQEEDEYENIPSEGRPVQEGEYPHVAMVGIRNNDAPSWSCNGAVISNRFVLSSAQCVQSRTPNIVRLGATSIAQNAIDIPIEQIIVYPTYNSKYVNGDLALIKLSSEIKFSRNILPACLWPNTEAIPLKLYTLSLDDGLIQVRPRLSKYNQDCSKFFRFDDPLDGSQLCAENYYSTDNTCQDKNGDPLEGVITKENRKISIVIGLAAYSIGCPTNHDTVTIYTRLSAYMDWIRSIVES